MVTDHIVLRLKILKCLLAVISEFTNLVDLFITEIFHAEFLLLLLTFLKSDDSGHADMIKHIIDLLGTVDGHNLVLDP